MFSEIIKVSFNLETCGKDGDHEVASNNRPISLLAALSKVCDKVVLNQFTAYLTERKLLSNNQSGNRKNHSTETLNVAFTDYLLEAIDKKLITINSGFHRSVQSF